MSYSRVGEMIHESMAAEIRGVLGNSINKKNVTRLANLLVRNDIRSLRELRGVSEWEARHWNGVGDTTINLLKKLGLEADKSYAALSEQRAREKYEAYKNRSREIDDAYLLEHAQVQEDSLPFVRYFLDCCKIEDEYDLHQYLGISCWYAYHSVFPDYIVSKEDAYCLYRLGFVKALSDYLEYCDGIFDAQDEYYAEKYGWKKHVEADAREILNQPPLTYTEMTGIEPKCIMCGKKADYHSVKFVSGFVKTYDSKTVRYKELSDSVHCLVNEDGEPVVDYPLCDKCIDYVMRQMVDDVAYTISQEVMRRQNAKIIKFPGSK